MHNECERINTSNLRVMKGENFYSIYFCIFALFYNRYVFMGYSYKFILECLMGFSQKQLSIINQVNQDY